MTIHETRTPLEPAEVLRRARDFFALAGTPSAAFPEAGSEGYLRLHMEVGEMVIGAARQQDGSTRVRGSASRGGHLLTHFLTTLAPPGDTRQTVHRRGVRRTHAAGVEAFPAASPASPGERQDSPLPQAA